MNIKKSLNIALAKKGIKKGEFAEKLGVSRARLYAMQNQKPRSAAGKPAKRPNCSAPSAIASSSATCRSSMTTMAVAA